MQTQTLLMNREGGLFCPACWGGGTPTAAFAGDGAVPGECCEECGATVFIPTVPGALLVTCSSDGHASHRYGWIAPSDPACPFGCRVGGGVAALAAIIEDYSGDPLAGWFGPRIPPALRGAGRLSGVAVVMAAFDHVKARDYGQRP